ncbi:MAG: urease accessory protein UreH domain-containing protein, partial [Promethearchaeota archaeon]
MILEIPVGWGGFSIILWTGIILGAFHSIIPCSQKYPVVFYSFGVARDWKQGFRIINFYGAGLLVINLIIGAIVTYFGAVFSKFFQINRNILNEVSGGVLIISGIIMIIQIKNNRYWPHSDQMHELTESLSTLRSRKRTAFLLGVLAGIPPCPMEITIYSYATIFSINYGWGNGVWTVLFFGLG